MNTENSTLLDNARAALSDKWGVAIGTFLVYTIAGGVFGAVPKVGFIGSMLVAGPLAMGAAIFSLSIVRKQDTKFELMFQGFYNFANALGAYLLMSLYVFLWMLLLIIPGIIAALSYSMVFYILADNPTLGAVEVLDRSKAMMDGHKAKLFRLYLRFFLLSLLCLLTLGIGYLWLIPYIHVTMAGFYEDIRPQEEVSDMTQMVNNL